MTTALPPPAGQGREPDRPSKRVLQQSQPAHFLGIMALVSAWSLQVQGEVRLPLAFSL